MLFVEKVLELIALCLIAAEVIGVDRARHWEVRLRDQLWATYDRPEYEVGNLFRTLDWRLAAGLARFNAWKAKRGLSGALVGVAAALAFAGFGLRLALR